jgi:hypothetical protein
MNYQEEDVMENVVIGDLPDLTQYSRIRVFLSGLWQILVAAVLGVLPALLFWPYLKGLHDTPKSSSGLPTSTALPNWEIMILVVLAIIAVTILAGGIGRIISAFSSDCYFRAGRDGIALRYPRQGWFGRFHLYVYRFKWSEIDQVVNFTHRVNLIPVSTSLHIYPKGGKKIEVLRIYFAKDSKELQKDLLTLQSESWKEKS